MLTVSTSTTVLASSYNPIPIEQTSKSDDNSLMNLWLNGRNSFELISSSENNKKVVSQFVFEDTLYQIEESFNDDYSVLESNFYKLEQSEKEFLGQQKTLFKRSADTVQVSVSENGKVLDTQTFSAEIPVDSTVSTEESNNVATTRAIEYKWFSQDFHISTYPFPHCTNSKHSLPSIFPCSCFSTNQRPAGCPERRFLTGRRVGWASGRLRNPSYPATYSMPASLRPSYLSFAKSLSRNSDTSSISSLSIKASFINTSRSV